MNRIALATLNCLAIYSCSVLVAEQGDMAIQAGNGVLQVKHVRGNGFSGHYSIQFNGRQMFTAHGLPPEIAFKSIDSKLILLSFSKGGVACPAHFRLVDVTADRPKASPDIGPCLGDLPQIHSVDGKLHLSTFRHLGFVDGAPKWKEQQWTYTPVALDHVGTLRAE